MQNHPQNTYIYDTPIIELDKLRKIEKSAIGTNIMNFFHIFEAMSDAADQVELIHVLKNTFDDLKIIFNM